MMTTNSVQKSSMHGTLHHMTYMLHKGVDKAFVYRKHQLWRGKDVLQVIKIANLNEGDTEWGDMKIPVKVLSNGQTKDA